MQTVLNKIAKISALFTTLASFPMAFASDLVTGAGSSFIAPVLYKWSANYNTEFGTKINYQSTGSGAGIKQIEGNVVDFGASDMPLKPTELEAKGLFQFPAIIGGIVMVTNIPGVGQGQLILDAKVIAEIYNGTIKFWNDPKILALNPNLTLPKKNILVVYRSDASGTTFNFTYFLDKAGMGAWKVGVGTAVSWPSGVMGVGGKGNEGITTMVKRAPGSIGYVEYAYAMQNKLSWARMINADGKVVPSLTVKDFSDEKKVSEAFRKALQSAAINANWETAPGMNVILANQKGAETWPLTASTFILIKKEQKNSKIGTEVLKFFDFAFKRGSESAQALDYIPIPENTYRFIEKKWTHEIKSGNDKVAIWK
ncbi:phosphate ABC transporter substrate-binding protein PstS [Pigmentibacter ruber]|uniref:phosphate ABC transporter substrate-binding protein PstS n=1 Tax=Pigmentibacter ruber TaxID=2683196 RepID=UPI00131CD064|nr:phosphate ABC transporter substrate-binding protein PstS [Pigmentibacter ruber]BFD32118.1 phosphate ABC transporter substrate-binding protein PstS [Pigmentibacter ruber]